MITNMMTAPDYLNELVGYTPPPPEPPPPDPAALVPPDQMVAAPAPVAQEPYIPPDVAYYDAAPVEAAPPLPEPTMAPLGVGGAPTPQYPQPLPPFEAPPASTDVMDHLPPGTRVWEDGSISYDYPMPKAWRLPLPTPQAPFNAASLLPGLWGGGNVPVSSAGSIPSLEQIIPDVVRGIPPPPHGVLLEDGTIDYDRGSKPPPAPWPRAGGGGQTPWMGMRRRVG